MLQSSRIILSWIFYYTGDAAEAIHWDSGYQFFMGISGDLQGEDARGPWIQLSELNEKK